MDPAPRVDSYEWSGGREKMLRWGPEDGPVVLFASPLFEEANLARALIAGTMRGLAERGIGSSLPDLPGQGESILLTADATLPDWRKAFAAASDQLGSKCYIVAIRGGALVDCEAGARARAHLDPKAGKTIVRNLLRARRASLIAAGEKLTADDPYAQGPPLLLAGNLISKDLIRALMTAEPGTPDYHLTLRWSAEKTHHLIAPPWLNKRDGRPLYRSPWLAAEPSADPDLVLAVINVLGDWVATCEG